MAEAAKKSDAPKRKTAASKAKRTGPVDMPPMSKVLSSGYVQKDKTNEYHRYKYASDDAVTTALRSAMGENGLYVDSFVIIEHQRDLIKNRKGEILQHSLVHCEFHFSDGENTYGPYQGLGESSDVGDKAVMKALTAARKYALSQASLVSWGDDPEGDSRTDRAMEGGAAEPDVPPSEAPPENVRNGSATTSQRGAGTPPATQSAPKTDKPEMLDTWKSVLEKIAENHGVEGLRAAWRNTPDMPEGIASKCRVYCNSHASQAEWLQHVKDIAEQCDERKAIEAEGAA